MKYIKFEAIKYIINAPSNSSIKHISYKMQKDILDKGLDSLVYLIELVNFNKTGLVLSINTLAKKIFSLKMV